jgi:hypothetical protein
MMFCGNEEGGHRHDGHVPLYFFERSALYGSCGLFTSHKCAQKTAAQ